MKKNVLAVLIAKSGVALKPLIPSEWEVVISDHSRLDQRGVEFWNLPSWRQYDEVVVFDRNVTTALTQRKVAQALCGLGIQGPVKFAGNPETDLAWRHQDYILNAHGFTPRSEVIVRPEARYDQFMLALVGLPASGKTMLRKIFSRIASFSVYKWGKVAGAVIEQAYGPMTPENSWTLVKRFTDEVERKDKVVLAREFVRTSGIADDKATFAVVDGIKRREQIIYSSYATHRPVIVVRVERDETERQSEAVKRGDFDDAHDGARKELLRGMGAIDVMDFADFVVTTTGNAVVYDKAVRKCLVRLSPVFVRSMHELLAWIFVSNSLGETTQLLSRCCKEIGEEEGYQTEVEV